jgi:nitroimidazol reductase NimA-like FMN-containing flavoprotein (pyridoxamine 5'-phosphate oxidase superfamily)
MSGAIPQLSQYTFMAWCSVKAQGQLHFIPQKYSRSTLLLETTASNILPKTTKNEIKLRSHRTQTEILN